MKALIVYGTRYGATEGTSEEIAKVLRGEGIETRVVDAKKEKVKDISEYDLVVVGSGMQMDRWTKEPENFLKRFKKGLAKKKVAIFVSSGVKAIYEHENNKEALERSRTKYLDEKAAKYSLKPIAMEIFGGVMDYNKMGWLAKKTVGMLGEKFEEAGFKKKDNRYDTRNLNRIRSWAKDLAKKARA